MIIRRIIIIFLLTIFFLAAGTIIYTASSTKINANDQNKIGIVVSILPEAEFVEKVGGDKVKVTTMVPGGADPHTYEPLPEQLEGVSGAKIYVQVGSGLEFETNYMNKLKEANKNMIIVNSSKGINLIPSQDTDEASAYDTHVWVSPQNAEIMVENIYEELIQVDPSNKEYFRANKDKYIQELNAEDEKLNNTLKDNKNKKILVYHPAWAYLCRDYGLTQIAIEQNGKEPTAQIMANTIDQAKKDNIKIVFASPQYSRKSADSLASEIGGQVVIIDDLDKNYIPNLDKVSEAFKNALQ